MISGPAIIDSLATFPFFIDVIVPDTDFISFAWLRIFRLALLFRTSQLGSAISTCFRVLWVNRQILTVSVVLVFFMLLVTSSLLWAVSTDEERKRNGAETILDASYLALLMLTGQGTPDPPMNPVLQFVVALTAVLSVPFFAVPAAMLTWGFEGEAQRLALTEHLRRDREKVYGDDFKEEDFESSSSDDSSELDEYLDGLAGDDDNEEYQDKAFAFFRANQSLQGEVLYEEAKKLAADLRDQKIEKQRENVLKQDALELLREVGDEAAEIEEAKNAEELGNVVADEYLHKEEQLAMKLKRFSVFVGVPSQDPSPEEEDEGDSKAVIQELRAVRAELRAFRLAEQSPQSELVAEVRKLREEVQELKKRL